MSYAITHNGVTYGPGGQVTDVEGTPLNPENADAYSKEVEKQELAWLQSHPDKVTLYVKHPVDVSKGFDPNNWWKVTTWLGTVVCEHAFVGPRKRMGFGDGSYRRAMTAIICGVKYHGWYFESSGQYCRLKKAKKQG